MKWRFEFQVAPYPAGGRIWRLLLEGVKRREVFASFADLALTHPEVERDPEILQRVSLCFMTTNGPLGVVPFEPVSDSGPWTWHASVGGHPR